MVRPGQTLVIMTTGDNGPASVGMQVIQGPVSTCELVDAPAIPATPSGGFSTRTRHPGLSSGGGQAETAHTP
jgi:hypothetical protein